MVKHISKYSCESVIYFNLSSNIIKENCKFELYFIKTDVKSSVLDGGHESILGNWPNDKHIVCTINNDILVNIPSFLMFCLLEVHYAAVTLKLRIIFF